MALPLLPGECWGLNALGPRQQPNREFSHRLEEVFSLCRNSTYSSPNKPILAPRSKRTPRQFRALSNGGSTPTSSQTVLVSRRPDLGTSRRRRGLGRGEASLARELRCQSPRGARAARLRVSLLAPARLGVRLQAGSGENEGVPAGCAQELGGVSARVEGGDRGVHRDLGTRGGGGCT